MGLSLLHHIHIRRPFRSRASFQILLEFVTGKSVGETMSRKQFGAGIENIFFNFFFQICNTQQIFFLNVHMLAALE
jgi:hypothetical protein